MEELAQHLPPASVWLLGFVFIFIVLQEGVNRFHDTANAVTTVIYSNSLKPDQAIIVSIVCNFFGVLLGGMAVAFSMTQIPAWRASPPPRNEETILRTP
jgi:hypothetical protein